jgi:hypothetical protein
MISKIVEVVMVPSGGKSFHGINVVPEFQTRLNTQHSDCATSRQWRSRTETQLADKMFRRSSESGLVLTG